MDEDVQQLIDDMKQRLFVLESRHKTHESTVEFAMKRLNEMNQTLSMLADRISTLEALANLKKS